MAWDTDEAKKIWHTITTTMEDDSRSKCTSLQGNVLKAAWYILSVVF